MSEKTEKCIIVGGSGSGKDWLSNKLKDMGLKVSVKTTTRPKRQNETESITYNFISEDNFNKLLESSEFICHQSFLVTPKNKDPQTWFYGLTKDEFEKSQVFIMTPGELKQIPSDYRKELFVVYLDIDRQIREKRISGRNDNNDSVKRRLDNDEIDFKDFNDYDLKITDPEFEADLVYSLMF